MPLDPNDPNRNLTQLGVPGLFPRASAEFNQIARATMAPPNGRRDMSDPTEYMQSNPLISAIQEGGYS